MPYKLNPFTGEPELTVTAGSLGALTNIDVDASTAPGTDPVVPAVNDNITLTGAQVASGTVGANVVRSFSGAANTVTMQVQRSGSSATQNTALNGVAHFNSTDFTVSDGFVSLAGGAGSGIETFTTDVAGPVSPNGAGNVAITGSTNVFSDGTVANTMRLNVQGTNHALFVGRGANTASTSLSTGNTGQILQSAGSGADPAWTTSTYPSSNIQGNLIYGSAANVYSNLAPGSNGDVLTLAGGVPTWAAAASGGVTSVSGTLNRINSTGGATPVIDIAATYVGQTSITTLGTVGTGTWQATKVAEAYGGTNQTTYSTGDILYAVSSNTLAKLPIGGEGELLTVTGGVPDWSAAAGGGLMVTNVTLTSAQVKALRASPVVIVPAPGAGKFINAITIAWKLNYGGTNPFTAAVGQTIPLAYTGITGTQLSTSGFSNTSIAASSDQIGYAVMTNSLGTAATNRENQPIVAYNSSATEITGNAANNNTITISVTYQILDL